VGLQPAWLLISLPVGARLGSLMGLGELLGLLLAVPVASCGKTFLDAWRAQASIRPEPEGPPASQAA
jgi:predicted PurR-regulated permease PerM